MTFSQSTETESTSTPVPKHRGGLSHRCWPCLRDGAYASSASLARYRTRLAYGRGARPEDASRFVRVYDGHRGALTPARVHGASPRM